MASNISLRRDSSISEVAAVLQSGFFLVTGSVSDDGCPIIFILDGILPEPAPDEQKNALIYISRLPTFSTDSDIHYCFILDRRRSTWTCVRKILNLITTSFSKKVKEVVLLQPNSFFQRKFSSTEAGKLQQEYPTFQMIVIDDTDALVKRFGSDNLCEQLGGIVATNTASFIQQRMSIDSLEANCVDLEERVKDLLLMDSQTDFDIPNDVASTEALINEHAETKNNLSDEIANIKNQGEITLKCFREEVKNLPPIQQMLHIQEIQRLTARLEDLEEAIRDYWEKEEMKLTECMKLREFHDEFKHLQQNLNKLSDALVSVRDYVSSVEEASTNVKRLSKIDADSESLLSRAQSVAKEWLTKLDTHDEITLNTVRPKCEELLRLYDLCTESLKYKQMLAEKQVPLYSHLDEARVWLADDVSSLADIGEEGSDKDQLEQNLKHIECQVAIGKFLELLNFDTFLENYKVALNESSQATVQDTYQKGMELMVRYEVGIVRLMEEIAKLAAPTKQTKSGKLKSRGSNFSFKRDRSSPDQVKKEVPSQTSSSNLDKKPITDFISVDVTDTPKPLLRQSSVNSNLRVSNRQNDNVSMKSAAYSIASSTDKSEAKQPPMDMESKGMFYIPQNSTETSTSQADSTSNKSSDSNKDQIKSIGDTSNHSESNSEASQHKMKEIDALAEFKQSNSGMHRKQSLKVIKDLFNRTSRRVRKSSGIDKIDTPNKGLFERSLTLEEEEIMANTRSLLLDDLIKSEEKYIEDLRHIIEFYMKPIAEAGDNVPTELYANQSLLFSNLEELYDFSSKIFLHELKENRNSSSLVGATFKLMVKMLTKYKDYCSSRSRAEVLLRQLADDSFLAERYRLQGHKTTLCTLLLLPARRVIAYGTFLKSMLANLKDDEEAKRDVSTVITSLADTISTADNLLHQVTIDGYHDFINELEQADLQTHGCLLHQGQVNVIHDKKNHSARFSDFKSKAKPRQLFLFEKCAIVCKIKEDNNKLRPWSFVHAIKLSPKSMEMSDESSKFILRGNHGSYLVICDQSDRDTWFDNIKFALDQCDEQLSPLVRSFPVHSLPEPVQKSTPMKQSYLSESDEDVILTEDPDIDMFGLEDDLNIMGNLNKKSEVNGNSNQSSQYILIEDFDNDLLLGRGDIVECVSIRRDMMEVSIPGTGIKSWLPCNVLTPYD